MSKAVTWIKTTINTACVYYGFPHLIKKWLKICCFTLFCEFLNLQYWATAYLFMPQIATQITVLSLHLVVIINNSKGPNYL